MLRKVYYRLTGYLPRKMPTDSAGLKRLMEIMIFDFGLPDEEKVWICVMSNITARPAHSIRISYGNIANSCKRLYINQAANQFKLIAGNALEQRLKASMEAEVAKAKQDGNETGEKQPLPDGEPQQKADQARDPAQAVPSQTQEVGIDSVGPEAGSSKQAG